jgi:hypothetical protein
MNNGDAKPFASTPGRDAARDRLCTFDVAQCYYNQRHRLEGRPVRFLLGDVRDRDRLTRAFEGIDCDRLLGGPDYRARARPWQLDGALWPGRMEARPDEGRQLMPNGPMDFRGRASDCSGSR